MISSFLFSFGFGSSVASLPAPFRFTDRSEFEWDLSSRALGVLSAAEVLPIAHKMRSVGLRDDKFSCACLGLRIKITVDVYGHLVPSPNIEWIDQLDPETSQQQKCNPDATRGSRCKRSVFGAR
jgi:hypothetical protein